MSNLKTNGGSLSPDINFQPNFAAIQRFVNLLTDAGFKAVFGDEANKDIIIAFINEVLQGERTVKDITFCNNEVFGKTIESKGVRFDLNCVDETGTRFVIEMQRISHDNDFYQRSVYYGAKVFDLQLNRSSRSYDCQPVYVIGIMEDRLAWHKKDENKQVLSRYVMREKNSGEVAPTTISTIFVELGLFNKELEACNGLLEKWFWCLKNAGHLKERPEALKEEIFRRLFKACEIAEFSPEKRLQYEEIMMTEMDYRHDMYFERKEGIEEGAMASRLAIAKAMKNAGEPIDKIIAYTGLSEEQVKKL